VFNINKTDMIAGAKPYSKGAKGKVVLSLIVTVATIATLSIGACTKTAQGGVDLVEYCKTINYSATDEIGSDEFCASDVDLSKACQWEHKNPDLRNQFENEDNPNSGVCRDSQGKSYRGISDMTGYCKYLFSRSSDVIAKVVNGNWTCRTKIDMNLVCSAQYQDENVVARYKEGTWRCYK